LIRSDDAKPRGGERVDLMPPADPEIGKAMKQDDRRALNRSRLDHMEAQAANFEEQMFGSR
jgi:hypothetical protein